jgi:rRNA-processing protein FCF1
MARFFRQRRRPPRTPMLHSDAYLDNLAGEFNLAPQEVLTIIRSVGFDTEKVPADLVDLLREVIACKLHQLDRFKSADPEYGKKLDEMLRDFDEIYIDTAPIIQMDWFLHFVADVRPILRRRKKKLIILEKTMEELHGLKDNPEKDRDVRVRATIRPDLIRWLCKQGYIRIGDTGSRGIADDHLVKLFSRIGQNENVLLVTQDRGLSERIIRLGHASYEKGPQAVKQSFWEKLFHKPVVYQDPHEMVVCKLTEGGLLKRCYICPDCQQSYYDEFSHADGMIPDSACIAKHQQNEAKLRAEEERKVRLEQQRAAAAARRAARPSVEKRIRERQRKLRRNGLLVVLFGIFLVLVLLFAL